MLWEQTPSSSNDNGDDGYLGFSVQEQEEMEYCMHLGLSCSDLDKRAIPAICHRGGVVMWCGAGN